MHSSDGFSYFLPWFLNGKTGLSNGRQLHMYTEQTKWTSTYLRIDSNLTFLSVSKPFALGLVKDENIIYSTCFSSKASIMLDHFAESEDDGSLSKV